MQCIEGVQKSGPQHLATEIAGYINQPDIAAKRIFFKAGFELSLITSKAAEVIYAAKC